MSSSVPQSKPVYRRLDSDNTVTTRASPDLGRPQVPTKKGSLFRLTPGGVTQSMFTLISTSMGGGVLCLPYVMKQAGIINGLILLVVSAALAILTMYLLMESAQRTGRGSYGSLLGSCCGRWSAAVMDAIMFFYGMGTMTAYLILEGDFLPALFAWIGVSVPRTFCIFLVAIVAIPLVLPEKLSVLRHVTPISTLALIFTAICTLIQAPGRAESLPEDLTVNLAVFGWPLLKCLTITLFAYICHTNVVPVANELIDPTPKRCFKVSFRVAVLQLGFYILIGVSGYLSFLSTTHQNYITNYSHDDVLINLCRLALALSLMCSIPINTNPTARAAVHFISSMKEVSAAQNEPLLDQRERLPSSLRCESRSEKILRISISLILLVVTLTIAILVPGIADVYPSWVVLGELYCSSLALALSS
ncbi:transmembrane amino acid transporter, putative [Perkinsus marinus ATCC 50983]|uniref:Transmembrane amino acid transporter, putative n=1 Tax=Perkinsus marinus (strain ATCC 50983 / TXsc) TaxID=423536 RepID=C5L7E6_PERM5|nr:transmembrane amino acid transporter, putative [Perkinsus marinus ATCC 50983]EER07408.1 transmembrane amino acid transporter, putative [Perkinsus marinus ATCC 50983]|eukprot:XP_002775592.1 transmembrane amino acid transporter, putative [Perkinsus marinus ATCC 50983]